MTSQINFSDPTLVAKHGSWVRVQVAFYDFLFEYSLGICAGHFNEALTSVDGFSDGAAMYEHSIEQIEQVLLSPEQAWTEFLKEEANQLWQTPRS